VIPGDGWDGDRASFRRAFTFRTRVEDGELEPEAVRERLASEGTDTDDDAVAERLVETAVPGGLDGIPPEAASELREAATAVAAGDHETARGRLRELCPSPCVDETPQTVAVGETTAACHRVDPARPSAELD
jgi:peptide/nickel transport system ATP-binding protein